MNPQRSAALAGILLITSICPSFSEVPRGNWEPITQVTEDTVRNPLYGQLYQECQKIVGRGRYMEQRQEDGFPHRPTVPLPPGWEALRDDPRLLEYRYRSRDNTALKRLGEKWVVDLHGQPWDKRGWVIMYNSSAEKLAAWIANAVIETSPDRKYHPDRALRLAAVVNEASNAQFPVVGVVWEDLYQLDGRDGEDGVQEAYPFLDGTTVKNSPKEFYRPEQPTSRAIAPLDDATLQKGLKLRWEGPATPGLARIGSTDREMCWTLWKRMGISNPPDIEGVKFAGYVRDAYQKAMGGVRNELLVACALSVR
jgi:hypothetical protein